MTAHPMAMLEPCRCSVVNYSKQPKRSAFWAYMTTHER